MAALLLSHSAFDERCGCCVNHHEETQAECSLGSGLGSIAETPAALRGSPLAVAASLSALSLGPGWACALIPGSFVPLGSHKSETSSAPGSGSQGFVWPYGD